MRLPLLAVAVLVCGCLQPAGDDDGHPPLGEAPTASTQCPARPEREHANEDWSREDIVIDLVAAGPFTLDVALPVSPNGSSAQEWVTNATASGPVTLTLVSTERGQALRIAAGAGPLQVLACTIQAQSPRGNGCCAEQFLDRDWSLPVTQEGMQVRADGAIDEVGFTYRALSNWCGADGQWNGTALAGWSWLQGSDGAWCA